MVFFPTLAQLVVAHLQHFVGWDDIKAITLISPPDQWPATIRLEYVTAAGEHRVDESEWEGLNPEAEWPGDHDPITSTRSEAEMFLTLTLAHLDEHGLL